MANSIAQTEFDRKYITSTEIIKYLGISRAALFYARNSQKLPEPIELNDRRLLIWERPVVQPYLEAWRLILNTRRGV